jgi:hypothetical protein
MNIFFLGKAKEYIPINNSSKYKVYFEGKGDTKHRILSYKNSTT